MNAREIKPKDRPRCKGCGKALRAVTHKTYEQVERAKTVEEIAQEHAANGSGRSSRVIGTHWITQRETGRVFSHWEGYDGFHSLRCALRFAISAYEAGYRR